MTHLHAAVISQATGSRNGSKPSRSGTVGARGVLKIAKAGNSGLKYLCVPGRFNPDLYPATPRTTRHANPETADISTLTSPNSGSS
jgi:hypothetical protein